MTNHSLTLSSGFAVVGILTTSGLGNVYVAGVDGLETIYGGILGEFFHEAEYDFGTTFSSVESASLHLIGVTDEPGSILTFTAELDGMASDAVALVSDGSFDVTLRLPVGPDVLDGQGTIGLTLDTSGCCDLSSSVTSAELVFDAAPFCAGDTNADQLVNVTDLINVISDWGTSGRKHGGDVTGDGVVNIGDLIAVIVGWGECLPPLGRCCFAGIVAPPPYICEVTTEATCASLLDSFWEEGLTCDDPCEPLGRCCFVGIVFPPYLCEVTTETECANFVGSFWTKGLTCEDPCEPLGRCCFVGIIFPPYLCEVTTETECANFVGSFWTEGLTCDDQCEEP